MINHPEIRNAETTTEILAVLVRFDMAHRADFVDHFRSIPTDQPNGFGGRIWTRIREQYTYNKHRVNEFLVVHPEITFLDLAKLLDSESDIIDEYFRP